jgi:hypothetical protein
VTTLEDETAAVRAVPVAAGFCAKGAALPLAVAFATFFGGVGDVNTSWVRITKTTPATASAAKPEATPTSHMGGRRLSDCAVTVPCPGPTGTKSRGWVG